MQTEERYGAAPLGIAAMLLAMILLPISDALSKSLAVTYPPEQIAWVRNGVHAALLLPILFRHRGALHLSGLHLLRGLAFVAMTVLFIAALAWMPLANALAVVFLFPLIVTVASSVLLGERVGAVRWMAVMAGLVGILLIVRPGYAPMGPGVILALAAAFMTALYVLMTRSLSAQTPKGLLLAVPALIGAIVLVPVVPWRWIDPGAADWASLALVGGIAALAHFLIIVAYSRAEASAVAPLSYLQLVFGVGIGVLAFGDIPGPVAGAGMLIVLISGVVISWRESR